MEFRTSRVYVWLGAFLGVAVVAVTLGRALVMGWIAGYYFASICAIGSAFTIFGSFRPLYVVTSKGVEVGGLWGSRRLVEWAAIQRVERPTPSVVELVLCDGAASEYLQLAALGRGDRDSLTALVERHAASATASRGSG